MNILIADDHQLFRKGLAGVLKKFEFVSKIHEAGNGREAVEEMKKEKYEVVFMDIAMPVMDGADATKIIKHDFPETKVIVLTMYDDQKHVAKMIEYGISGYVIKNTDTAELKKAIETVMENKLYFSKQVEEGLIRSMVFKTKNKRSQPNDIISQREKEVLHLICEQYSSREIAASLYLSEKTVDWHRLKLLEKTQSKNTAGLVLYAMKNGIIEDLV